MVRARVRATQDSYQIFDCECEHVLFFSSRSLYLVLWCEYTTSEWLFANSKKEKKKSLEWVSFYDGIAIASLKTLEKHVQIESGPLTPIKHCHLLLLLFDFIFFLFIRRFFFVNSANRSKLSIVRALILSYWLHLNVTIVFLLLFVFEGFRSFFCFLVNADSFRMSASQVKYCSINYLGWWLGAFGPSNVTRAPRLLCCQMFVCIRCFM